MSVTHGTDVGFPTEPFFFLKYFPLEFLGTDVSQVFYLEIRAVTPDPGNFSDAALTGLEVAKVNAHI